LRSPRLCCSRPASARSTERPHIRAPVRVR
jgi:hypothetical protein